MYRPIVRSVRGKRIYHALLGRRFIEAAARIVATSEAERAQLLAGGLADSRVVVRANGIDLIEFENLPERGRFRAANRIDRNARLILFVGRIARVKGLDLLIEALRGLAPDVHLAIVGPSDGDGTLEEIERAQREGPLAGRIVSAGPLYGQRKLEAFVDADLLVLPSRNENFGLAAAEAVAAGLPVVLTEGCGIAPRLRDRAALVVPFDAEALRAALCRVLGDENLRATLIAGGRAVTAELSWDRPVAEMERIYREARE